MQVCGFLRNHMDALLSQSSSSSSDPDNIETTALVSEVLSLRMQSRPPPPSALYLHRLNDNLRLAEESANGVAGGFLFPIWILCGLLVVIYAYQHLASVVAVGYAVPIVNTVGLLFGIGFVAFKLSK